MSFKCKLKGCDLGEINTIKGTFNFCKRCGKITWKK